MASLAICTVLLLAVAFTCADDTPAPSGKLLNSLRPRRRRAVREKRQPSCCRPLCGTQRWRVQGYVRAFCVTVEVHTWNSPDA